MKFVNANNVNELILPFKTRTLTYGATGRLDTIIIPPGGKSIEYTDITPTELRSIIVPFSPKEFQIEMTELEYRKYSEVTDIANYVYFNSGGNGETSAGVVFRGVVDPPGTIDPSKIKAEDWYINEDTLTMFFTPDGTTWIPKFALASI